MYLANYFYKLPWRHTFQQIRPRSRFEHPSDIHLAVKRGQHDDAGLRKLGAYINHRLNSAFAGQAQIHHRAVRAVQPELRQGFLRVGGLADQLHLRLAVDDGREPLGSEWSSTERMRMRASFIAGALLEIARSRSCA